MRESNFDQRVASSLSGHVYADARWCLWICYESVPVAFLNYLLTYLLYNPVTLIFDLPARK